METNSMIKMTGKDTEKCNTDDVNKWATSYNKECPCCLEIPEKGRIILDCRHLLCIKCFINHLQRDTTCPVCRTKIIDKKELYTINTTQTRMRRNYRGDYIQENSDVITAANIERVRYMQENSLLSSQDSREETDASPLSQDIAINIFSRWRRNRRRQLRDAPPLRASRDETSCCDVKYISILIIIDIMVMAVRMVMINKTNYLINKKQKNKKNKKIKKTTKTKK